ncbi:hypothetical protein [Paenibacillus koleovorans]|uniref:hypothetical protein n=1 Tax=Paenibacillus koleovorans TaxID=121608 RepID=UPI000FDCBEB8|nr:hypothetical protein [Paenibacillus koleovorans]
MSTTMSNKRNTILLVTIITAVVLAFVLYKGYSVSRAGDGQEGQMTRLGISSLDNFTVKEPIEQVNKESKVKVWRDDKDPGRTITLNEKNGYIDVTKLQDKLDPNPVHSEIIKVNNQYTALLTEFQVEYNGKKENMFSLRWSTPAIDAIETTFAMFFTSKFTRSEILHIVENVTFKKEEYSESNK